MGLLVQSVCDSVRLVTAEEAMGRHTPGTGPAQTYRHIDRQNRHTNTDLWCSWPYRHTEAPALPPWWGRPKGTKAKEHRVPVLGRHLLPPPTHTNTQIHTWHRHGKRPISVMFMITDA